MTVRFLRVVFGETGQESLIRHILVIKELHGYTDSRNQILPMEAVGFNVFQTCEGLC